MMICVKWKEGFCLVTCSQHGSHTDSREEAPQGPWSRVWSVLWVNEPKSPGENMGMAGSLGNAESCNQHLVRKIPASQVIPVREVRSQMNLPLGLLGNDPEDPQMSRWVCECSEVNYRSVCRGDTTS